MNIYDYVIKNLRNDKKKDIYDTIDESVNEDNETILPGLGVLLKILWNKSNNEEKKIITNKIYERIKEETK